MWRRCCHLTFRSDGDFIEGEILALLQEQKQVPCAANEAIVQHR